MGGGVLQYEQEKRAGGQVQAARQAVWQACRCRRAHCHPLPTSMPTCMLAGWTAEGEGEGEGEGEARPPMQPCSRNQRAALLRPLLLWTQPAGSCFQMSKLGEARQPCLDLVAGCGGVAGEAPADSDGIAAHKGGCIHRQCLRWPAGHRRQEGQEEREREGLDMCTK